MKYQCVYFPNKIFRGNVFCYLFHQVTPKWKPGCATFSLSFKLIKVGPSKLNHLIVFCLYMLFVNNLHTPQVDDQQN